MSWKNILEDPKQYMIYLEGRILQGSKEADEKYLKKLFKYRMGRELDLDHPQALNDKLQWLKINDFKPIYTKFADKYPSIISSNNKPIMAAGITPTITLDQSCKVCFLFLGDLRVSKGFNF